MAKASFSDVDGMKCVTCGPLPSRRTAKSVHLIFNIWLTTFVEMTLFIRNVETTERDHQDGTPNYHAQKRRVQRINRFILTTTIKREISKLGRIQKDGAF